ncbi:hypothetical protein [Flavobacterium sp. HSC-61S13]|uniref:hypothetical protein n=1 Tax=Flavobacterium sp. HSC-61S13 TaxID=2910963 RepID=UPI0020A1F9B5|nr:hypothetical protein [Flavobacterium sp. HSC-61S13]
MKIDLFFYFLSLYPVKKSKELPNEPFFEQGFNCLLRFLCEIDIENELFMKSTAVFCRKRAAVIPLYDIIELLPSKNKSQLDQNIKLEGFHLILVILAHTKNNKNEKNYSVNPQFDEYNRFFTRGYDQRVAVEVRKS